MIEFDWMKPSPLTEWMVNSVVSVCLVALLGWLAVAMIPKHRAHRRSGVIIGVFIALLVLPLVRGWSDSFHWNRVSLGVTEPPPTETLPGDAADRAWAVEMEPTVESNAITPVLPPAPAAPLAGEEISPPHRSIEVSLTSLLL